MTLQDRMDAHKAEFEKNLAPEKVALMHRATEELRQSGILDQVRKIGDAMPEFSLPNFRGETIHSAELLRRGPLVVTFYRGVW